MNSLHYISINNEKDTRVVNVNSIIIGLFISIGMLTKLFTRYIYINNNIVILLTGLLFISLINNKFKFKKDMLFISFIILFLFGISIIRLNGSEYTIKYLLGFIIYDVFAMYLISHRYSVKKIMDTIYVVFIIFTIRLMPTYINQIQNGILSIDFTMDLSYTILIGIMAVVIKSIFYGPRNVVIKVFNVGLIIYSMYYLIFINTNRGSMIALFIFLILIYMKSIKNIVWRWVVLIIGILLFIMLIINIDYLLIQIDSFLRGTFNIQAPLIQKMVYQYKDNSFSSGRVEIWKNTFKLFYDNILLGGGIGYIETVYGYYAHNYIIQLLVELGLIFTIPFIFISIYGLYKFYKSKYENENMLFICFLFCLAIPRLTISETLWNSSAFWMYTYLVIRIVIQNIKTNAFQKDILSR